MVSSGEVQAQIIHGEAQLNTHIGELGAAQGVVGGHIGAILSAITGLKEATAHLNSIAERTEQTAAGLHGAIEGTHRTEATAAVGAALVGAQTTREAGFTILGAVELLEQAAGTAAAASAKADQAVGSMRASQASANTYGSTI